jgi:hypothetical protein
MNANEQTAKIPDWRDKTVADIRKIIKDADPGIKEEPKWMGSPVWSDNGIVCVAITCKDKVKLTFEQGAHLADPDKLFNNGLGKQWRTIDIHKDDKVNESSLKNLVKAAVAHNRAKVKPTDKPASIRSAGKKQTAS